MAIYRFLISRIRMILLACWVLLFGLVSPDRALRTLYRALDQRME